MTSPQLIARWCLMAGMSLTGTAHMAAQERSVDSEIAARRESDRSRLLRLQQVVDQIAAQAGGPFGIVRLYQPVTVAGSDPMRGPVVRNAPYSGDAVTTVIQTLGDATRIEQSTNAKFYRDSAGRMRREQTIIGLTALRDARGDPSGDTQTVITIFPNPDENLAFQLDTTARTARRVGRAAPSVFTFNSPDTLSWVTVQGSPSRQDNRTVEQSLGTRQMEGLKATGHKTMTTIPTGEIGNDRPIEITDERWESPELQVLLYSRHSDPRTGVVEYRLTNINRLEPPLDLFTVPPDYTILEEGRGGGQRGGGAGGRGAPASTPGARGGRQ
jgi:hypothetical protein